MKKTALVTGGSGGIGSEICRVLAEDGWQVAVYLRMAELRRKLWYLSLKSVAYVQRFFTATLVTRIV